MDDGPGLLPFKLGPMTLVTHYHSFLQYIDLTDIDDRINSVRNQITEMQTKLPNDTYMLYEIQLSYLHTKLDKVSYQLQSLKPHRERRGLINGLGTVIKSITGNLDYNDAIKYDDAIKILMDNQNQITSQINNHISLSKEWIVQQTSVITQIANNQNKINNTLHLLLNNESLTEHSLIKYAKFAQLLTIISDNVEDLSTELLRIEDILAFTHTSSTHHSMLGIDILVKMVEKLKVLYSSNQLLQIELREYYDVIETGSYFTGSQIVIVFRVPIISPSSYNLYKLPILPNKDRKVIIPPYPLIATDGKSYVYIEAECPKSNTRYLCHESTNQHIRKDTDCIQRLIEEQILDASCQQTTVKLLKETMEKLDDRHYTLTFPRPTQVKLSCERDDYKMFDGSYLATIPLHCSLQTRELTIYNADDHVQGQPMKILNVPSDDTEMMTASAATITLGSINLNQLRDIQDKIITQSPTHLKNITTSSFYHTTLPFYVILLSASALSILVLYRKCNKCKKIKIIPENTTTVPINDIPTVSNPHLDRKIPPATFPLNIKNSC